MEVGAASLALHAVNAAGVVIGGGAVTPSAAAAAASSASAAMYAKLDFAGNNPPIEPPSNTSNDSPQKQLQQYNEECHSPNRVASLRRGTLSEASTAPTTPVAPLDLAQPADPSRGTPAANTSSRGVLTLSGLHSFNSSRGTSSNDAPLNDPDAPVVDVRACIARLSETPLTGQVVAWAWERAAQLSTIKRAPPVSLLAALWPATESCAARCTAQDVIEIVDCWVTLLERWPRHFLLPPETLRVLSSITIPAAVKRMSESRLIQLSKACCAIAEHRVDPELMQFRRINVASPRDLMQPIFAVVAAETAWRASDPIRYVSPELLRVLLSCSRAWRWTVVKDHDPPQLVAMKESTRAALNIVKESLAKEERA